MALFEQQHLLVQNQLFFQNEAQHSEMTPKNWTGLTQS